MSWFNVWDGLKNKTCRYLLQRYLGQFLENPLNLEQLKIELYSGKATVKNVALKVEALNELFEEQGWSVELQSGHIGQLTVTVPWNSLITNDSSIEITDFELTLRPIKRVNDVMSMLESMWSSVSSSMQMAEECMRQTDESPEGSSDAYSNAFVGLEKFAETIDNVLNRIKAKFVNCRVRLEYPTSDGSRILALIAHIKEFNYKNETGSEKHFEQFKTSSSNDDDIHFGVNKNITLEQINLRPTFAKHLISFNGVQLFTEENIQAKSKYNMYKSKSMEIPVLTITKEQCIQIKVKQTEEVIGPKISLDIELGAIAAFCTPRQVHLLIKILEAFNEEDSNIQEAFNINKHKEKYSNDTASSNNHNFEKDNMTGLLHNMSEWGNQVETENIFATRKSQTSYSDITTKTTCQRTTADFYCDSITSSMTSSSTMTKSVKLSKKASNMENSVEILNFNAKILSISIALLHEDIIPESELCSDIKNSLHEKNQNEQCRLADKFLSQIHAETAENDENTIVNLCTRHCLFFQLLPLIINGVEQRNKNILVFKFSMTATKVDAYEILNKIISTIILFDRAENCSEGFHKRPELSIVSKSTYSSLSSDYKTNFIDITLDRVTFDLDITIYERLINILAPSPYAKTNLYSKYSDGQEEIDSGKSKKPKTDININSDELFIKLRIPKADTRPINDPNRLPWWHRNVRDDFFYFSFNQFFIKVISNIIIISSNEIDIYYCEKNDTNNKMHLVTVGMDSDGNDGNVGSRPEICIKILAAKPNNRNELCKPFSADRVCRQSDTAHAKRDAAEYETLVLPGETHEIKAFCDTVMSSSELQISLNLPTVDILLQSKLLFEIIYNRLVSDFLMWEPRTALGSVEENQPKKYDVKMKETLLMSTMLDSIYVSATGEESEGSTSQYKDYDSILNISNHDEEESKTDDTCPKYESIHISTSRSLPQKNSKSVLDEFVTSVCSVELKIGKGCLTLIMPVRDNNNHVLPGQMGKLNILLKKLELFTVTGCNNDNNLGYVCLQLNDIEAYHCGLLPFNYTLGNLKLNARIEEFMKSIFYKLPKGLTKGELLGSQKREMIALVIEIKKKPLQRVKRLKISTGIQMVTVRHLPDMSTCSWLNQLIDFFDVLDYPIDGYTPYGVVTEMQLHFWDCAIDYRPLNFPFRAVVEIGSFTLSSNIISAVVGCNMRLVLEDSTLSIAPNDTAEETDEKQQLHKITFLPSSNLVPVLDLGLLDISLRLSNGATEKQPLCDVRCSIHDLHFRTCADSGHALGQLIVHIANSSVGLDNDDDNIMDSSSYSDANSILGSDLVEDEQTETVTEQQQRVNQMMADAVQEPYEEEKTPQHKENESEFEVYFFPDETSNIANTDGANKNDADIENVNELKDILNFESNVMMNSYYIRESNVEDPLPQVKSELGSIKSQLRNASYLDVLEDTDFCVIKDEEKSYLEKCGITNFDIPDDPLRIVDNHFCIPTVKTDLLRAPDTFPIPEKRYTLCEMTFTWHLYGGFDFENSLNCNKSRTKAQPETTKTKMSDAYKAGVAYSKSAGGVQFLKKPKEKLTWKNIGGPGREHSILVEMQFSKVRLTHEVYPLNASHASRQVLVICDIEIRDRLQSSEINKFLYHPHTKTSVHNKSSENILIVKALHVRPNPQKSLAEECSLRISMLPLRLHIDQETLVFLIEYFSNLGDKMYSEEEATNRTKCASDHSVAEPMMSVDDVPEAVQNLQARRLVNENLDLLIEQDDCSAANNSNSISKSSDTATPTYFREVIFSPEVPICFDYHGRKVELSRGPVAGLLMGLFQLQCSEIRLRKLVYRRGLLGLDKLFSYIFRHWLQDIKRNQLPKILRGVGPTNALVQLFQGVYDLFWLPIEQYQRDGRIIRGLQLGAQSFSARTALAALEITSRIIQLLQYTAETAFDMVSPGPSVRRLKLKNNGRKKRPNRPKDLREGVTNALYIVKEGINESANNLIETAVAEHEQKGYTGAVGAVVRQIPQLVVCPAVLATQATTNILGGVRSSLVPEAKIEAREKWKDESE